ncbi:MAG: hypothetical protein PHF51_03680 [Candidatus ainarchaeum sp.]|nr:hypothetical protein [Candidatus ainarchaeum sp.]
MARSLKDLKAEKLALIKAINPDCEKRFSEIGLVAMEIRTLETLKAMKRAFVDNENFAGLPGLMETVRNRIPAMAFVFKDDAKKYEAAARRLAGVAREFDAIKDPYLRGHAFALLVDGSKDFEALCRAWSLMPYEPPKNGKREVPRRGSDCGCGEFP